MMSELDTIGAEWLGEQVEAMADTIHRMGVVEFNQANRYLPAGVTPRPGFIRYSLFPFLIEVMECFNPDSPVREVNFKKGVQVGYTTLLESVLLYYIAHVKSQACMFITADKELATGRVENNILPMINESGFSDLIRSSDEGNSRKTGKTKDFLQWAGGGFMVHQGAQNATKMRQYSVPLMLKDELDGWKRSVGQDGNSDALTDARLSAYWSVRKILRGSTPLLEPSMIQEAFLKGDQRKYQVLCIGCGFPQDLKQETVDKETGVVGGFAWDTQDDILVLESVRYLCRECGHEHFEADKERLFSEEYGAHWLATANPREPGIRSYHLPSFYSPFGFRPWSKCISDYLDAYDHKNKSVKSIGRLQEYYNNTLGEVFKPRGAKVRFQSVSAHRRPEYRLGQIPNKFAGQYAGSPILFLTCTVDVHLRNLAVTVIGWTRDSKSFIIDYWRFERENDDDDCGSLQSPVWGRIRKLIEETQYVSEDGTRYKIAITLVDAGYANDTITTFCGDYESGVYAILGRDRPAKNQTIREFAEFTTQAGRTGYRILVDHYKDRIATALRREWSVESGEQTRYHFNAPVDLTDKQLKELTVEIRKEKVDDNGNTVYFWHRPGNAPNELFDLLVYGHAAVEILAWNICIQHFELETIDWAQFWDFAESLENENVFGRECGKVPSMI